MDIIQNIDISVLRWIQEHFQYPVVTQVLYFLTTIGNGGLVWIGIGVILSVFKKTRTTGILVLISLVIGAVIGIVILKPWVGRLRPFLTYPDLLSLLTGTEGFSFPSGHTTASFCASIVIWLRHEKGRWGCLILAILIGFSRLYFFVHYPSDVLAGMILGMGCAVSVYKIYQYRQEA